MEWMNRGQRGPQPVNQTVPQGASAPGGHVPQDRRHRNAPSDKLRFAAVALLFSGTILVVALLLFIGFGGSGRSESKFVDDSKLQAVFLNGGQVYFGRIRALNNDYMRLTDIYYLRVNQQVQPEQQDQTAGNDNISLVKLGCELHGPQDEMVINRDQIVFWENLKNDGQVTQAVAEYIEQNPEGQVCEEPQQQNTPAVPAPGQEEDSGDETGGTEGE